jgi:hypothetical protein
MRRYPGIALVAASLVAGAARAQGSLAQAAERVRQGWLDHDVQAVAGHTPSLVVQIPGADPSAPVNRAQALELLRRHLRAGVEKTLRVSAVRELEPGRGYVELERRYVVAGTSDERHETVFLSFRRIGTEWLLTELRSAP